VAAEYFSPDEIDWTLSFSKKDKIPYGSHILYNLLENDCNIDTLITNNISLYEFFEVERPLKTNFIFLNYNFTISDIELDKILKYVKIGNDVFLSASDFSQNIKDSLKFNNSYFYYLPDSIILNFVNPIFDKSLYTYSKAFDNNLFNSFDTLNTTILGKNDADSVNFIKVKYGNGFFYLNLEPLAFTNYNLLYKKNYEYAFKSLSYLKNQKTYWDEFFKPANVTNSTPLQVIFKSKSLKTGYFLTLIGLAIYLIYIGKRQQRIIPIINPLKNTSLEFNEIIARLYLHRRNHKDIALKRFRYLLEFLRSKYGLKINEISDFEINTVIEKTGVDKETTDKLFDLKKTIDLEKTITEDTLFQFNMCIENFYKKCK